MDARIAAVDLILPPSEVVRPTLPGLNPCLAIWSMPSWGIWWHNDSKTNATSPIFCFRENRSLQPTLKSN